jgi:hypothetical protein
VELPLRADPAWNGPDTDASEQLLPEGASTNVAVPPVPPPPFEFSDDISFWQPKNVITAVKNKQQKRKGCLLNVNLSITRGIRVMSEAGTNDM